MSSDVRVVFAVLSACIVLAAGIHYAVSVVMKKAQPEIVSWLIWTLLGTVYLTVAVRSGGAVIFSAAQVLEPLIILLLALFLGAPVGGRSVVDRISLIVVLIAIVFLFILPDGLLSLILSLAADAIGGVLTVRKVYLDPRSEPLLYWFFCLVASSLAIASIDPANLSLRTLAFPIYLVIVELLILFIAFLRRDHNPQSLDKL